MTKVAISLCDNKVDFQSGLVKVSDFYEKAGVVPEEKRLYLDREKDIDIPLLPNDHIILHGGERIFADDPNQQIGENPAVRRPIVPTLNDGKIATGLPHAKITGADLQRLDVELDSTKLFADLAGKVDAFIPENMTIVVQDSDCYFTIPSGDDDDIDLEACEKHNRKPPKGQKNYKVKIDGEKYRVATAIVTGVTILGLVNKTYAEWSLNKKTGGGRRKAIENDEEIDLSEPGIERFETSLLQAQQG